MRSQHAQITANPRSRNPPSSFTGFLLSKVKEKFGLANVHGRTDLILQMQEYAQTIFTSPIMKTPRKAQGIN